MSSYANCLQRLRDGTATIAYVEENDGKYFVRVQCGSVGNTLTINRQQLDELRRAQQGNRA